LSGKFAAARMEEEPAPAFAEQQQVAGLKRQIQPFALSSCSPYGFAGGQRRKLVMRAVVPDEFMGRIAQAATTDGFVYHALVELASQCYEFWQFEHSWFLRLHVFDTARQATSWQVNPDYYTAKIR
jgi:hypothetical protein